MPRRAQTYLPGAMSSRLPIARHSLVGSRRALLAWTIAVAATLLLYLPLYPSIGGNGQMQHVIDSLPPALVKTLGYTDIASGAGYAQSTFYGLMGFVLFIIAATSWGSSCTGGAEESGWLSITLAHGVGRFQYAFESSLVILIKVVWLGVFSGALVIALTRPFRLEIATMDVVAASAALTGLAFLSGAAALVAGFATGRRADATSAGASVAVMAFLANAVGRQVGSLQWLQDISPYAWAFRGAPLRNGTDVRGLSLLWGSGLLCCLVASCFLGRRDIIE